MFGWVLCISSTQVWIFVNIDRRTLRERRRRKRERRFPLEKKSSQCPLTTWKKNDFITNKNLQNLISEGRQTSAVSRGRRWSSVLLREGWWPFFCSQRARRRSTISHQVFYWMKTDSSSKQKKGDAFQLHHKKEKKTPALKKITFEGGERGYQLFCMRFLAALLWERRRPSYLLRKLKPSTLCGREDLRVFYEREDLQFLCRHLFCMRIYTANTSMIKKIKTSSMEKKKENFMPFRKREYR